MINPFDDVFDKIPPLEMDAGFEASKNQRWEHRVCKVLLEHYGLQTYARSIMEVSRAGRGVRALTFEAFKASFPSFPLWLVCRKIPWVHKTEFADLVRKFTKSRPFKAYQRFEGDAPEAYRAGRLGVVFEWVRVWPMCVLTNYYHGTTAGETAVFYEAKATNPRELFVLQSFRSFLNNLPWAP